MQIQAISFPTELKVQQFAEHFSEGGTKVKAEKSAETTVSVQVHNTDQIEKITSILAEHDITLKFSTDTETNAVVVEMVDEKTGEAIRQFPSAVSLKLAASFAKLQGQFINRSE